MNLSSKYPGAWTCPSGARVKIYVDGNGNDCISVNGVDLPMVHYIGFEMDCNNDDGAASLSLKMYLDTLDIDAACNLVGIEFTESLGSGRLTTGDFATVFQKALKEFTKND